MRHAPSAPYAYGSETSKRAAYSVDPHMPQLRLQVLCAIEAAEARGLTDEEIADRTGLAGNTVRPRRGELEASEHIVDSGRTRPTRSGRQATVWVVETFARDGGPALIPGGASRAYASPKAPIGPEPTETRPSLRGIPAKPSAAPPAPEEPIDDVQGANQLDFGGLLAGMKGAR